MTPHFQAPPAPLDQVRAAIASGNDAAIAAAIDQAVGSVDDATAAQLFCERAARALQAGHAVVAGEDAIACLLRDPDSVAGLHLLTAAAVALNLTVPAVLVARVLDQHPQCPVGIKAMIADLARLPLTAAAGAIEARDHEAVAGALAVESARGAAAGRFAMMALLRDQPVNVLALHTFGVMWSEVNAHALAIACLGHLVVVRPSLAIGQFAYDRALVAGGRYAEAFERRRGLMTAALAALAPPASAPVDWDVPADRTAEVLASLYHRGFAVVRQAFDPVVVAAVETHLFAAAPDANFARPGTLDPGVIARLLRPAVWSHLDALGLTSFDAETSFARQVAPNGGRALDLVAGHFHQDSQVFFQPLINVWMPLDACGVVAPGLTFIDDPSREILETEPATPPGPNAPPVHHTAFRVCQAPLAGRAVVSPTLEPGDAVLFLGSVPHRTYLTPAMTERRRSVEFRFVQPDWALQPIPLPL